MKIVGFAAMSHAPFWNLKFDHRGPGERYVEAVAQVRAQTAALDVDVIVVFGPDHFRNFFFDAMPPFCIGAGEVESFGDYGTPKGPLPGAPDLGRFIVDQVMSDGFDPATSLRMGVDHGIVQAYVALVEDCQVPIIPIMINCSGAAMPTMRRCHEFGRSVGQAIRAAPATGRAFVLGSGGLSHSPPSGSPYVSDLPAARRDYLVNGRPRAQAHSTALDAALAERVKRGVDGPVNAKWDTWFLSQIVAGDLEPLLAMTSDDVLHEAGPGGQEVRNWLAALGAWGGPVEMSTYESVPSWITGMGCVATADLELGG